MAGLNVTEQEIENFLKDMKMLVIQNRYRIERNENREENDALFFNYNIDEKKARDIILGLTVHNFCEKDWNLNRIDEGAFVYVFGTTQTLMNRFSSGVSQVEIYIKFDKIENKYVFVISFHERKYKLNYYFK